jgi:hypothetical protein
MKDISVFNVLKSLHTGGRRFDPYSAHHLSYQASP